MRNLILMICLPLLVLVNCSYVCAAKNQVPEEAKIKMIGEITRGSDEVFNCTAGLSSDKEIADCRISHGSIFHSLCQTHGQ